MIETVMIFALGFLAAALCALLALPAVNARAVRLSRRRIEARLPLSVAEVAAEKDHLRAEFAVARRRLERRVEAAHAVRHADMAALGARTLEAAALSRAVEAKDATLRERQSEIAETRATLADVTRDLSAARAEGVVGLATLRVLEDAHRDLLDDLVRRHHAGAAVPSEAILSAAPSETIATAAAEATGAAPSEATGAAAPSEAPEPAAPSGASAAGPDLTDPWAALVAERETLRASLAAAEEALAQATARMGAEDAATAALRVRIGEVADTLLRRDRLPAVDAYPLVSS